MNILQKQVVAVCLMGAGFFGVLGAAVSDRASGNPAMDQQEGWAFVLEGEAATLERCVEAGDLLRHIVVLREAGWTQSEVDALVENEETRSLTDLVFRLNERGLSRSDDLAESLTDLCTAQLRLVAQ